MEESSRLSQQWAIQMDTVRRRQHEQEEQAAALEAQAAVLRNDQAHNQENIARITGRKSPNRKPATSSCGRRSRRAPPK